MRFEMSALGRVFSLVVLALAFSLSVFGQAGSGTKQSAGKTTPSMMNVTIEGEIFAEGLGGGTKSVGGYACKVFRATAEGGSEVPGLKGQTLHLADSSKSLFQKHSGGNKVLVNGKLNLETKVLEVLSLKPAPAEGSDSKEQRESGSK